MQQLCAAAAARDWAAAQGLDQRLQPLFEILAVETNPIPVKWALFEMKRVGPQIRLPLTRLDEAHRRPLRECLQTLELLGA
jgi:4-hydroxy-tetrahydrodipicolinate synthase